MQVLLYRREREPFYKQVKEVGIPWRRKWQPTPVFLPGKFHGQRSLVGYSLCESKELDMTEHKHFKESWEGYNKQSHGLDLARKEESLILVGL